LHLLNKYLFIYLIFSGLTMLQPQGDKEQENLVCRVE